MDDSELLFNIFYAVLCIFLLYPPAEFVSLGFTVEGIIAPLIRTTEKNNFVLYHLRRTTLNLLIHGSLPAIFFMVHHWKFDDDRHPVSSLWLVSESIGYIILATVVAIANCWYMNDFKWHPISRSLTKFAHDNQGYGSVAIEVVNEVYSIEMLKIRTSSIVYVISTENWIMKTTPYTVHFAKQSDSVLEVNKSDTLNTADNTDLVQMLNIDVKCNRDGVKPFQIRINALDFRILQDRLQRPIAIPEHVQFHRNVIDRFIEVFKEQVSLNPTYRTDEVSEKCFACMLAEPNVKLHKQCLDVDVEMLPLPSNKCCDRCNCRPMWCVDCLARWFAARQNDVEKELWLQQKCSCPLCRAKFCILDVSYIEKANS